MFTVFYICAPVACDYRYTLSTVCKLTPRAAAILPQGFLIDIIVLAASSRFRNIFLLCRLLLSYLLTALLPSV